MEVEEQAQDIQWHFLARTLTMLDHKTQVNWFFGGTVIYLWHAWILIDPGRGTEEAEGKRNVTVSGIPAHTYIFRVGRRPSLTIKRKPTETRELVQDQQQVCEQLAFN